MNVFLLQIEVLYEDEPLKDYYTLMDIAYIYTWRRVREPDAANNKTNRTWLGVECSKSNRNPTAMWLLL